MPAPEPAQKRPGIVHRHSSSAVSTARSPHADLSSSAQKQPRPARFVVGNNRLGARNLSHGKNLNKLSKLTPARPADASPTSPTRPSHVKRNSSNINLDAAAAVAAAVSAAPLRKNHSETSLKKNRSSGHLVKLARPSSSRNVSAKVATKNRHRRSRTSVGGGIQAPEGPANPTVRFDLGHEEEDDAEAHGSDADDDGSWSYTDSHSPSTTRSSTRRNSLISQHHADDSHREPGDSPESSHRPASASLHPSAATSTASRSTTALPVAASPSTRPPAIMDRLLKRNLSFTAAPQITSNPATPIMIDPHEPVSQSHNTLNDSSNPDVVSRFLTQSTSTSGPSHQSSFLPRRSGSSSGPPQNEAPSAPASPGHADDQGQKQSAPEEREPPRRNKSLPNFSDDYVSRTQQRLNLERESAAAEATSVAPPRTLLHVSRLSSANIPFTAASSPGGGVAIHVRQLCDRSNIEYKRVRMYQNPLASAISRLRDTGQLSRPAAKPAPKSTSRTPIATDTPTGASTTQLSQSWRSARSAKTSEPSATPAPRRPRVMFQGISASPDDERDDGDKRASLDGADERRTERDALRELCGRMWARNDARLAGGE